MIQGFGFENSQIPYVELEKKLFFHHAEGEN